MSVAVSSLVADIRVMSGLRNSRLVSDDQIAALAADALKEMEDVFIQSYQHWLKRRFPFTLAGGAGGNAVDLAADVPDFQMVQLLTRDPSAQRPQTVPELDSIANLNTAGGLPGGTGSKGRRYFVDGDELQVLPASVAAGDYELLYTPQCPTLVLPISIAPTAYTRSIDVLPGDVDGVTVSTVALWELNNGAFTAADVGGNLAIAGATSFNNNGNHLVTIVNSDIDVTTPQGLCVSEPLPGTATANLTRLSIVAVANALSVNAATFDDTWVGAVLTIAGSVANDGAWTVASVPDAHTVILVDAGNTLVNETFGVGVTITAVLEGTLTELPQVLTPWALFLKVHASIAIRTSRQQDTRDLQAKLQQQRARAVSAAKTRSEGVTQPPVTRARWGSGWGRGGAG